MDNKINWKQKLSSRKLWTGVAGWLTSLLAAFHVAPDTIAQVALIIAGIGSLAVYMLAEGMTDKARGEMGVPLEMVEEYTVETEEA